MKKFFALFVLVNLLLVGSTSSALVIKVMTCQTSDNLYRVSIFNNEGIGMERTPNYGATVYTASGEILGAYPVKRIRGMSISFGQVQYLDKDTGGHKFNLSLGSTNYRHIILRAQLNNGRQLIEVDPVCRSN